MAPTSARAASALSGGLHEAWGRATATASPLPVAAVLACAALALALVAWRPAWRRARHVVTMAHEGAHGVVAACCGRRLRGIRLHSDTSGVTVSAGRATGPGVVATLAAGYPGPALVGLGGAALVAAGRPAAVLWVLGLALVALAAQVRNGFGALVVALALLAAAAVDWWAPAAVVALVADALVWFLLLGAPRAAVELAAARSRERRRLGRQLGRQRGRRGPGVRPAASGTSDADQLAALTGVPAAAWVAGFVLLTAAVGALGAAWLLGAGWWPRL